MILVSEIREFVMKLPESLEVEHWGKPSFRLKNKIFAVIQEDEVTLTIKTTADEREIYTQLEPQIFRVPETFSNLNYMHVNMNRIDPEEAKSLLIKAWKSVATKKLIKEFEEKFGGDHHIT
ncbi:MmcQ/YjbR family DNA-binding protein [Paenibacillus sp. strain BS8-2]